MRLLNKHIRHFYMKNSEILKIKLAKSIKALIKLNKKKNHIERDMIAIRKDIEKYKCELMAI